MTSEHPAPETPLYVVGDIHGRADLLSEMLERIEADRDAEGTGEAVVVLLGDYVDRGGATRATLDRLRARMTEDPRTVCLMGNHERMMLDALDRPEARADRWLTHGGLETLESYGLGHLSDPDEIAARLRAALPEGMEDWLRALPLLWRSGDVVCVHAALDPALPPEGQDPKVMLWARPPGRARRDKLWVIHGHTVVETPSVDHRRVAIDTGAWFSDRLTAAAIRPGTPIRFLRTGG